MVSKKQKKKIGKSNAYQRVTNIKLTLYRLLLISFHKWLKTEITLALLKYKNLTQFMALQLN